MDPSHVPPRKKIGEILATMEALLPRVRGGVIATDADGTLWDGDVGIDLFEALLDARGVRPEATNALATDAALIGLTSSSDPNVLARSLYEAYKHNRYRRDRAFAMMAWVFAGWTIRELDTFVERVLDDGKIGSRVRPEMREVLAWAAKNDVEVFIVSASAWSIVVAAGLRLGVPKDRIAAMMPGVTRDGVIQPQLVGPVVYGEGKLHALERAWQMRGDPHARTTLKGSNIEVLAAFGDSAYDAALLRAAEVAVAVPPAPELIAMGASIPKLVVLDR